MIKLAKNKNLNSQAAQLNKNKVFTFAKCKRILVISKTSSGYWLLVQKTSSHMKTLQNEDLQNKQLY